MQIKLSASGLEHDFVFELAMTEGEESTRPGSRKAVLTVEERYRNKISLDLKEEEIRPILDMVENSRISPFAPCPMGMDGVTYTLTLSDNCSKSTFEWWVKADENWLALDRIARVIIGLAEKKSGNDFRLL